MSITRFMHFDNSPYKRKSTIDLGFLTMTLLVMIMVMTPTQHVFSQANSSSGNFSNGIVGTDINNHANTIDKNHSNENVGITSIKKTSSNQIYPDSAKTESSDSGNYNSINKTLASNGTFANQPKPFNQNVSLASYSSFVNEINSYLASKPATKTSTLSSDGTTPSSKSSLVNSKAVSKSDVMKTKILSLHEIVLQNTSMSAPAPVRHPGQPSHEVVFALPLRSDGKIWTGTVTFTASKPIEVEVLHTYSPVVVPDSIHGKPYNAILPGNNSIAITHLRQLVDVPIEINGVGISSGTLDFAGNALLFHKTSGEPFTVTYTLDATAKKLTDFNN